MFHAGYDLFTARQASDSLTTYEESERDVKTARPMIRLRCAIGQHPRQVARESGERRLRVEVCGVDKLRHQADRLPDEWHDRAIGHLQALEAAQHHAAPVLRDSAGV